MAGELVGGVTGIAVEHGSYRFEYEALANGEVPDVAILKSGADVGIYLWVVSGTPTVAFHGTDTTNGAGGPANNFAPLREIDGTVIAAALSAGTGDWFQLKVIPVHLKPVMTGTGVVNIVVVQRGGK